MGDCGTGSLEGGYVKSADVLNCDITGSSFRAGVIDTVEMHNITSIDDNSAKVICEAIADKMTPSQLQLLAGKILEAIQATGTAPARDADDGTMPVQMMGRRTAVLGEPETWVSVGDGVIPCYRKD